MKTEFFFSLHFEHSGLDFMLSANVIRQKFDNLLRNPYQRRMTDKTLCNSKSLKSLFHIALASKTDEFHLRFQRKSLTEKSYSCWKTLFPLNFFPNQNFLEAISKKKQIRLEEKRDIDERKSSFFFVASRKEKKSKKKVI